MIKSDLVERVMKATDLPKPKANEAVNALFDGMKSRTASAASDEIPRPAAKSRFHPGRPSASNRVRHCAT